MLFIFLFLLYCVFIYILVHKYNMLFINIKCNVYYTIMLLFRFKIVCKQFLYSSDQLYNLKLKRGLQGQIQGEKGILCFTLVITITVAMLFVTLLPSVWNHVVCRGVFHFSLKIAFMSNFVIWVIFYIPKW